MFLYFCFFLLLDYRQIWPFINLALLQPFCSKLLLTIISMKLHFIDQHLTTCLHLSKVLSKKKWRKSPQEVLKRSTSYLPSLHFHFLVHHLFLPPRQILIRLKLSQEYTFEGYTSTLSSAYICRTNQS